VRIFPLPGTVNLRLAAKSNLDGYGYPLTVTDQASRFLLTCEALSSTREDYAFTIFERLFKERGLPANLRSDNGVPSLLLTRCSTWANLRFGGYAWALVSNASNQVIRSRTAVMNAGISLWRKKLRNPPPAIFCKRRPASTSLSMSSTTNVLPEALAMKCPVEIYQPSDRAYTGLPDIDYPLHDKTMVVTGCGRICLGRKKINFSTVFAGQAVGIKRSSRRCSWALWIMIWDTSI
jgi:putative transposase